MVDRNRQLLPSQLKRSWEGLCGLFIHEWMFVVVKDLKYRFYKATTIWRHWFGGIYFIKENFPCHVTSLLVGEIPLIWNIRYNRKILEMPLNFWHKSTKKKLSIIHSLFHHWQYNNYLLTNNPTIFKKSINFFFLRKRSRSSLKIHIFSCIYMIMVM